ncbi:unnamed protein product [Microthlaspi erraticum]|uniref:Uncharacterized protein n=1 Tax=Microthlaspi erraticum TaxID=1685480 RepID=A0A6D2HFU9_9BRAS|nr:unnamed protein product [Microthlaspi erraticum]
MGSLMSGWDSKVGDANSVKRCKSLTREDIDAFWKTKKKSEEEHVQAVSKLVAQEVAESQTQEEKRVEEDRIENQSKWWRKSNWAFLNEPREEEGGPNNYVPQFQVAHITKIAG